MERKSYKSQDRVLETEWLQLHLIGMLRSALVAVLVLGIVAVLAASFVPLHKFSAEDNRVAASAVSPVLVELFTSEGCSSCPPADKLLGDLDKAGQLEGVPVIALGEHVDYWDRLGWRDRFSSHDYTDRQQKAVERLGLDSAYTPQMIVDGRIEFVGNDETALRHALSQAAKSAKSADVQLSWNADKLNVAVYETAQHAATVLLAITETNLTTNVERGENSGRVLHHAAVVRKIISLGDLKSSRLESSTAITPDVSWKTQNLKAVVFVQDKGTGAVIGAQSIPFPKRS